MGDGLFHNKTTPRAREPRVTVGPVPEESRPGLRKVVRGLGLIYWGIAILALSLLGGMVLISVLASKGGSSSSVVIVGIGVLIGIVMGMIGRILCLGVPSETGGKQLIIGAVICDVLGIICTIIPMLGVATIGLMGVGQQVLPLVALLLFLLFMKRTASFLGRGDLAHRVQTIFVLSIISTALATALVLLPILNPILILFLPFLGLITLVLCVIALLMYIRLLNDMRQAIQKAIA